MNMIKKAYLSAWIKHRYDEAVWITTHHQNYHEKFHFKIRIISKRLSDFCWKHSINNKVNELPSRLDMPSISSAAHLTLSTRPEYNNPGNKQPTKSPDIKDQESTLEFCRTEKAEMKPILQQLKQTLEEANIAYQQAYTNWNSLAKKFERLDIKEHNILHAQKMAAKATKKPATTKSPKAEESAKKLAMKILANLSPEKQAEILALIQKQSI